MKLLIVGGAGLVGSLFAEYAYNHGHEVLILDNFTSNTLTHAELVGKIVSGNANSFSTLNRVFASFNPDAVFHFADSPYDKEGTYEAGLESDVAVSVTNNLLRCVSIYRPKFVFYGSSGEVYKGGTKRRASETSRVGHFSYTGATNLYIENMLYLASKQYDFVFTSLRFFQVFGPRKFLNPKHDVVTFFIDSILKDDSIVIVGPDTYIDILSFTDAAKSSYLVFKRVIGGTKVNSINIGSGNPVKLYDLYCCLVDCIDNRGNKAFKFPAERQTRSLVADIEKLESLGWDQTVPIRQALEAEAARREKIFYAALR